MSNGINSFNLHSLVGDELFREQPTASKITNVYETLIMQPDHAHHRLQGSKIVTLEFPVVTGRRRDVPLIAL